MSREEELDYLIEQRLNDAALPPETNADDAARVDAAMVVSRLNALEPPPALAERLEARLRTQARAHQNGHVIPLPRPTQPRPNTRRTFKRAWMGALATAAVLVLAVVGVTNAAASSLPGDPLYAVKQWEQQMALSNANGPAARLQVQITQLQTAIADLETAVSNGRSDADIMQALGVVAANTRDSQAALSALPVGTERTAAEHSLATTLQTEQTTLYRLLGRGDWSLRLAFSGQLKALGAAVPIVTSVAITSESRDSLKLTLTGANFAPGAQVVINGNVRGTVTQNNGTTLTATINESDWHEGESAVGVLNPDGTAGQKIVKDDDHHDGSDDGGDDDGGNNGPGGGGGDDGGGDGGGGGDD
jgi:hypothetical protein